MIRRPPIRRVLRLLLLVVIACAAFAGVVRLFAERLIFLPPREGYEQTPEIVLVPRSGGGSVAAVHLPNPRRATRFSRAASAHRSPPYSR